VTSRWLARLAIVATLLSWADSARAQRVQPEMRVDIIGPEPYVVQPGVGAVVALGYYARISADVGYGLQRDAKLIDDRWRVDLLSRFTLDPFRQQRWGLSIGGGLSFRRQTYLAAIVDLEGPEWAGLLPAVEVGVSGGWRAGVIFRRAIEGRR
jgi:hypothetical protein